MCPHTTSDGDLINLVSLYNVNTTQDTDCLQSVEAREQTSSWRSAMLAVLFGQYFSFRTFAIVPLFQAYAVGILRWKSKPRAGSA
jgi:hypothetical protein